MITGQELKLQRVGETHKYDFTVEKLTKGHGRYVA